MTTSQGKAERGASPGWLRAFHRTMDRIADAALVAAEVILAVMLAMNLLNILSRNLGAGGLLWVSSWTSFLMVWCVFLSFFPIYRRGMDITLDVVTSRVGPRATRALRLVSAACGLLVCGVLVAELPQILARQRGVIEFVGLQRHWLSIPMVLSAALLVLHFAAEILAVCCGWRLAALPDETEQLQW